MEGQDGSYSSEKFELVAPKEPTDEELAAEYRKNYARQVEIRKFLQGREYTIKIGATVVGTTQDVKPISITKTITTTKEI